MKDDALIDWFAEVIIDAAGEQSFGHRRPINDRFEWYASAREMAEDILDALAAHGAHLEEGIAGT